MTEHRRIGGTLFLLFSLYSLYERVCMFKRQHKNKTNEKNNRTFLNIITIGKENRKKEESKEEET